jgi:NTP pyrophosphatase (non-canonical NTP hydrolase)
MNIDKLNQWAKEIHDNATAHGWHEEKHSPEHLLALVMCEVAEAIEADRKGKYYIATGPEPSSKDSKYYYQYWYENNVKGTVEEEFADIVIRLLDMAYELYGEDNPFWYGRQSLFRDNKSFVEHAWYFVHNVLNSGMLNVTESVIYVYNWAESLGIDLDQHIEWKMKYNESRPYKHGGKKY